MPFNPGVNFLVVGSGFSGAVLARELVENLAARVWIIEERQHIGGNCYTERDAASGVMVHRYGPHIFNTDDDRVWNYVNSFGRFQPFVNRVKAHTSNGIFSLPINLQTINQVFARTFSPDQARAFILSQGDQTIGEPQNFEEQALKFVGRKLYELFFEGYTRKQWGCDPRELPASILKRLPIRFNYDDNYYSKTYQGIPEAGYTALFEKILDHPRIQVELGRKYESTHSRHFKHTFFTGPIDSFFNQCFGRLSYRTVNFERIDALGDFQGNAVINYTDQSVPWTRIHEHKHFTPWETHERTVAFKEFSSETGANDEPYYPKRLKADLILLQKYRLLAEKTPGITLLGRLATYRYMDMERVIAEALDLAQVVIAAAAKDLPIPTFPNPEP